MAHVLREANSLASEFRLTTGWRIAIYALSFSEHHWLDLYCCREGRLHAIMRPFARLADQSSQENSEGSSSLNTSFSIPAHLEGAADPNPGNAE